MSLKLELIKYKILDTFYNNLSNIIHNYKDIISTIRYDYHFITTMPVLHEQENIVIINKIENQQILTFSNNKTKNNYTIDTYINSNIDMLGLLGISNISKILNKQFKIINLEDKTFPITELLFQDITNLLDSSETYSIVIEEEQGEDNILFYKSENKVYYTESGKRYLENCLILESKYSNINNLDKEIQKYFSYSNKTKTELEDILEELYN